MFEGCGPSKSRQTEAHGRDVYGHIWTHMDVCGCGGCVRVMSTWTAKPLQADPSVLSKPLLHRYLYQGDPRGRSFPRFPTCDPFCP